MRLARVNSRRLFAKYARSYAAANKRHPDVMVRIETVPIGELRGWLLEEKVDLMFGPRGLDTGERLRYRELFTYKHVLITALDHPLAGHAPVSLREAGAYPAIVPPTGTYSRRLGDSTAGALGVDINVAVEVGGWGMLKRYVEADIGISVVPDLVLSDSDQLSVVAIDADFPTQSFGVFTLRDEFLAAPARRFLEMLAADASGEPPGGGPRPTRPASDPPRARL